MTLPERLSDETSGSPGQLWHPLPTLIWYLAPAVGLVLAGSWLGRTGLWLAILVNLLWTRPRFAWLATRVLPVWLSVGFFAIWLPWTIPGPSWWPGWVLSPTETGLAKGLELFLRGTGVAMAFLGLGRGHRLQEWLAALQQWGVPSLFLTLIWITIQQTERLIREWKALSQAHRSRGSFLVSRPNRMRLMANSWAQLLVRVTKRADDLQDALQARAFRRSFVSIQVFDHRWLDWLGALCQGGLVSLVVVLSQGPAS